MLSSPMPLRSGSISLCIFVSKQRPFHGRLCNCIDATNLIEPAVITAAGIKQDNAKRISPLCVGSRVDFKT